MAKIDKVINDRFNVNSFIFHENNTCIIIDSNINTYDYIIESKLIPEYIFLTHEHFDHIIGISRLKERFPDMKVVASKEASELMQDCHGNLSLYYDGIGIKEIGADIFIEDVNQLHFRKNIINMYYTPGHTTGGIIIQVDNILFTGDTLLDVKTPTNMPNSSKQQLRESLDFIDKTFDKDTIIYQGHGMSFSKKIWNKDISLGNKK